MKSVVRLVFAITASTTVILAQPRFEVPLTITNGSDRCTRHFGILPGAHFCPHPSDTLNGHCECEPGPHPPVGFEGTLFTWPRSDVGDECFYQGVFNDYRPFTSYAQRDTFRLDVRRLWLTPTVIVSWPSGLRAHFNELTLKDVTTNGRLRTVDMLSTTFVDLSNLPTPDFRIYSSGPHMPHDTIAVNVQVNRGWNLVSNPVITANDSVPKLFPICTGCGYWPSPSPGYDLTCKLPHGKARWLNCPAGGTVTITGLSLSVDTIAVVTGWNGIGSISYPVDAATVVSVPPGIRVSAFFGLNNQTKYFFADSLFPGHGYWVKMNAPGGRLILRSDVSHDVELKER